MHVSNCSYPFELHNLILCLLFANDPSILWMVNVLNVSLFCSEWTSLLERFLPRQIAITRAKRDWELDILSRYRVMVSLEQ